MANEIFISYRRSDAGWAGRIYDRIEKEFEAEGVFIDVKSIQAGHEFDAVLTKQAETSKVMLSIVSDNWISDDGIRRLNAPDDYVRRELEIGIRKKRRIVPVLIEQVPYLTADRLPQTLQDLASIQALRVTHHGFRSDADHLIEVIKDGLDAMSGGGKRTWDRTLFLEAARTTRGAPLEQRLEEVLDWGKAKHHLVRWGNGAKYGTAQIVPNSGTSTVLSVDTTGLIFVYMNNLHQTGALRSTSDRESFIDQLNTIQGVAIPREKAAQAFISFQIRNVDRADITSLLRIIDAVMERVASP